MMTVDTSKGSADREYYTSTACSLGDLIHLVTTRITSDERILWFRGHRSAKWALVPSLWRSYPTGRYRPEDERNLTNRFRARAATRHQALPRYDDFAIWLSLMQHYGLPTRLLDWTRSPLIAAYFSVEEYIYNGLTITEDAVIWILEPHILNSVEDFGDVTPSVEAHKCEERLKAAFTDDVKENGGIVAAMAAEKDIRMFVQQGCFTIHSDQTAMNERFGCERYLSKVVLPAECVGRIANEIDVCGFRKGDLFPDLGHLADELKSSYPPLH